MASSNQVIASDVLVIGGGLSGIVTALESLRAGMSVTFWRPGTLGLWRHAIGQYATAKENEDYRFTGHCI